MKKRVIGLFIMGLLTISIANTYAKQTKPKKAYCDGWWGDCRIVIGDVTIEGDGSPVVIY